MSFSVYVLVMCLYLFLYVLSGWTSRQQFEETWMGLLGVLNPVQREGEAVLDVEVIFGNQFLK